MNHLSFHSIVGGQENRLCLAKCKDPGCRTYGASGDFGKIECREFRYTGVLFHLIHMELNSKIEICFLPGKVTGLLNYCMKGHFLFQTEHSCGELIAQSQAKLHDNRSRIVYSCSATASKKRKFFLFSMVLKAVPEKMPVLAATVPAFTSTIGFQKEVSGILRELERSFPDPLYLKTHAGLLLLESLEQSRKIPVYNPGNSPEKRMVHLLAEDIVMGMDEPWTLKTLAGSKKMNPDRMKKLFKKHMNLPVTVFKISVRMKKATQLLRETNRTIQDISLMVGYPNPGNFSTLFKRKMGCSPSDFRKGSINLAGIAEPPSA